MDFYEYYEGLQEGWDGPALLVFSDGKKIGARLDRNGLRPARFWRTSDDTIYVASEVGVLGDVISNAENVVAKGRLGPGQMVCADLSDGSFSENAAISKAVATKQPYKEWLGNSLRRLEDISPSSFYSEPTMEAAQMLKLQAANGMGAEDAQMVVEGMAQTGVEPTYCMGDDIPLAVLSDKPHMLYDYFKQRFAQVGVTTGMAGWWVCTGNRWGTGFPCPGGRAAQVVPLLLPSPCWMVMAASVHACWQQSLAGAVHTVLTPADACWLPPSLSVLACCLPPGDQPAHRPAARGPGDVSGDAPGRAWQPAVPGGRHLPPGEALCRNEGEAGGHAKAAGDVWMQWLCCCGHWADWEVCCSCCLRVQVATGSADISLLCCVGLQPPHHDGTH